MARINLLGVPSIASRLCNNPKRIPHLRPYSSSSSFTMSDQQQQEAGYRPVYPQAGQLPDPGVRDFITNFYRISDMYDANEQWIGSFTKDAQVTMGTAKANTEQGMSMLFLSLFLPHNKARVN